MLEITEPPENYPITLAELKAHLHYAGEDHDDRLTAIIAAATQMLERMADRCFISTQWRLNLASQPTHDWFRSQTTNTLYQPVVWPFREPMRIYLPKPPLQSVDAVKYYNTDNELVTVDDGQYYVQKPFLAPAFIEFANNFNIVTATRPDAFQVEFTAGADEADDITKHCVKVVAGWLDDDRNGQQMNFEGLDRLVYLLRNNTYA